MIAQDTLRALEHVDRAPAREIGSGHCFRRLVQLVQERLVQETGSGEGFGRMVQELVNQETGSGAGSFRVSGFEFRVSGSGFCDRAPVDGQLDLLERGVHGHGRQRQLHVHVEERLVHIPDEGRLLSISMFMRGVRRQSQFPFQGFGFRG